MSLFYLFLIGILIGTAMIIPGVSGAVIAVIFGVYEKMIYSLTNLFKNFKKNFLFLFILGLGILLGAIWFSNIMLVLYNKHEVITKFSFIGLILGGVPFLFKEIKQKKDNINYFAIIITFIFSFILIILSKNVFKIELGDNTNFLSYFIGGIIYSIGKVIPGISGSFFLILIGMYEYVLSVFSNPIIYGLGSLNKLIPFIFGLILGVIVLLKLINYLLKNHFGLVYSIIIGFVIGSIPLLLPSFIIDINMIIGIFIMIISFIFSYMLTK